MPRIFISYRRTESANFSLHLYEELVKVYGADSVFIDLDSVPPGVDFPDYLDWRIGVADVVLVVIGPDWLNCRFQYGPQAGRRRIDDPGDFVHLEISRALERQIPVVPLLIGGAAMPAAAELPDNITKLARCNAAVIASGEGMSHSVQRLLRRLDQQLFALPSVPPKEIVNSLGMHFVHIQPGDFLMGALDGNRHPFDGTDSEPLLHMTINSAFYISAFLITQHEYMMITGLNPSHHQGNERLPVEKVTWHDAVSFCKQLGQLPMEQLANRQYRLPTEAEWEYCCRAGSPPSAASKCQATRETANCASRQTTVAGNYPPNPWGLYDMLGNLFEWCADGRGYVEDSRTIKGGCYASGADCRCSFRNARDIVTDAYDYIGFRVVCITDWRRPGVPD
jgi:formylglycine-generating enzyme required for sulfatase activity